jgi:hypothetical protein
VPTREEEAVFSRVADAVRASGHSLSIVRRPDEEERTRRAVDFEINFDGALVGVEITSSSEFAAEFQAGDRLERGLEDELRPFVEAHGLGKILLTVGYRARPAKHKIPKLISQIADDVRAALFDLGNSAAVQLSHPHDPIRRVEITRLARTPDDLRCGPSMPAPAYFLSATVDDFIRGLVRGKAGQTAGYQRAWIVIFQRTPVLPAEDVTGGFERHAPALPANWERVYFFANWEGGAVIEVFRRSEA